MYFGSAKCWGMVQYFHFLYAQLKVNLNKLSMSGSAIGSRMETDEKLEDLPMGEA